MSITALSGPVISYGQAPSYDYNPELATSLFWGGVGLLDPRTYYTYEPGQDFGNLTAGWLGVNRIVTLDGSPITKATNLIAASAHVTSGTAMTLASATADGILVGATISRADTGVAVTGLLKLDPAVASVTANLTSGSNVLTVTAVATAGTHGYNKLCIGQTLTDATTAANIPTGTTIVGYGTGGGGKGTYLMSANATASATGDTVTAISKNFPLTVPVGPGGANTIQLFNPLDMISRAVSITSTTSQLDALHFTVKGYDVYGYPITEVITTSGTSATTTNGLKAFKYIASVTPDATDGTGNYSVGTQDVIGLPLRSDFFDLSTANDIDLTYNDAVVTSATGYTAAVLTTPTNATGDVRGTYALQTAANGTRRLIVLQSPNFANINNGALGLYGQTQYANF